jgi:acyl-CoA dehydrogenase
MKLSIDDLPMFFEPRHAELAKRLVATAPLIAAAERDADPDRACVRALSPLFPLVAPGDGRVDARSLCLARETLGYVSPRADSIFAVQGLGTYPLLATGHHGQGYADGTKIGAFALTEPDAGSDVAAIATRATEEADAWSLEGDKLFISNLGIATDAIVFATVDPAQGRKGITAFHVLLDAPGVTVEPIEPIAAHPLGALKLRGARGTLVGEVGQGFKLAMQTLDTYRVSVGAAAVGMARRALDEATAFVRERHQFGKPLADQPLVQAHVADMACDLDAARLLVLRAAWSRDHHGRATTEVSEAKLFATEAAQRVIDRAVQLFGGRGVVRGAVVEELYRAIRPLRIYEGTSEIQRTIIGRALLGGAA